VVIDLAPVVPDAIRDLHPRDGKYGHAAMFPMQAPAMFPAAQGSKKLISVGALVRDQGAVCRWMLLALLGAEEA
jgi:hypothetical protein